MLNLKRNFIRLSEVNIKVTNAESNFTKRFKDM